MVQLPVTITQYNRSNVRTLAGIFLWFLVVGYIGYGALASSPRLGVTIFFAFLFLALMLLAYSKILGQKIICRDDEVVVAAPFSRLSFAYKDVEKIGYRSVQGRRSAMVSRMVLVSVASTPYPLSINLTLFSFKDKLLFLDILAQQTPQALFGDNISEILQTRNFPEPPRRAWRAVFGTVIQDAHFGPIKR